MKHHIITTALLVFFLSIISNKTLAQDFTLSYNLVDTEIDDNCTILPSDQRLNFYYFEKYNIVAGENDQITVSFYDYRHDHILDVTLNNTYGPNYHSLYLTGVILPGISNKCYQVEINGANKGLTYYLNYRRQ